MITRLEIDGFKSLRDFAIDLEPLTVLIGPNSAGKSNILEALALLSRLATQPIAKAFNSSGRGRPSDQFTRSGTKTAQSMSFAVEFLLHGVHAPGGPQAPEEQSRYRYELTIERQALQSGAERLVASKERLHAMSSAEDTWIHARPGFQKYASYHQGGSDRFVSPFKQQSRLWVAQLAQDLAAPVSNVALSQLPYAQVRKLVDDLADCRFSPVGAARLGDPSDRLESDGLAPDASNLPTILAGLPKPLLGEIRADLVALVPGIASFDLVSDGDEIRIEFELSGGDRLPARLVSDGTLRILVLLTVLRLEPRPSVVCIEEPENGIYPGRLRALLGLFLAETQRFQDDATALARLDTVATQASARSIYTNLLPPQILLTTHSPVLLAALRQSPQHLRFIDAVRRDGHRITRVRTVGRPNKAELGRTTVSPREIELLLDAAKSEDPA